MSLYLEYLDQDDLSKGLVLNAKHDADHLNILLGKSNVEINLSWEEANALVSVIIAHREMMDAKERLGRIPELTPPGAERPEDVH